jgi:hypothetical protein
MIDLTGRRGSPQQSSELPAPRLEVSTLTHEDQTPPLHLHTEDISPHVSNSQDFTFAWTFSAADFISHLTNRAYYSLGVLVVFAGQASFSERDLLLPGKCLGYHLRVSNKWILFGADWLIRLLLCPLELSSKHNRTIPMTRGSEGC